jgi:hypothetical protein
MLCRKKVVQHRNKFEHSSNPPPAQRALPKRKKSRKSYRKKRKSMQLSKQPRKLQSYSNLYKYRRCLSVSIQRLSSANFTRRVTATKAGSASSRTTWLSSVKSTREVCTQILEIRKRRRRRKKPRKMRLRRRMAWRSGTRRS